MTEVLPATAEDSPQSLVMYRIGGENFPLISDPRCKTCRSPYRLHIESEVISARPISMIIERLVLQDSRVDLSAHSVRNHIAKHMPAKHAQMRRIAERRATERGKAVEGGLDNLIDGLTVAETIVQKGYEEIVSGRMRLKAKDVIQAAKLLEFFEGAGSGIDEAMYVEAFMIYHEGAQRFMTEEQFAAFGEFLSSHDGLRRLQEAWERAQRGETTVIAGEIDQDSQPSLTEPGAA